MSVYRRLYNIIDPVLRKGEFLSESLNLELSKSSESAPFLTASAYGVFDWLVQIDHVLSALMKKRPKPAVNTILRLGTYLVRRSDVPAYAAVNGCVELCAEIGKPEVKGFVNAVLKKAATAEIILPNSLAERLSLQYSVPLWVAEKLYGEYKEVAEGILERPQPDLLHIRVNTLKIDLSAFINLLSERGIPHRTSGAVNCIYADYAMLNASDLPKEYYVKQSLGSVLIAGLLKPKSGEKILDACAAPGGKAAAMASECAGIEVTAADIHEHRTELIKSYLRRLGIENVRAIRCDGTEFQPSFERAFDGVLVDAPCSGLGIMRSKPDIMYFRKPEDIEGLAKLQLELLLNNSRYVRSGGRLVYSTCTLLREENEEITEKFLRLRPEFSLSVPELPQKYLSEKTMKLLPDAFGGEGFYAAVMVRND